MGSIFAKIFKGFGKKEMRILMVGLDAAGTLTRPSENNLTILFHVKSMKIDLFVFHFLR
jgi:hypothetical protein